MKKILFIILNLISILIEYTLIYLFFNVILNYNFTISTIMTFIILLLFMVLVLVANHQLKLPDDKDEKRPLESKLLEIINVTSKKYNKKFKLHYVTLPQPNPAWCIGSDLYINNSIKVNPLYLPGIVAHELGHAISGVSNYTLLASLKPSTLISKTLYLTIVALENKKNKLLNIFIYVLLFLYVIFSLNNIIFTYPFLISDEFTANDIVIKLGYGESLRCYYGLALFDEDSNFIRKIDFMHPKVSSMLDRVNNALEIKDEYLNFYSIDGILLTCFANTKTITLPDYITEIGDFAFTNTSLKKVSSKNVVKVNVNSFYNNLELVELNLPNVKYFPTSSIRKLNMLNEIKINDLNIIKSIYLSYNQSNRLFNKKLYKILKNNNLLNDENNLQM